MTFGSPGESGSADQSAAGPGFAGRRTADQIDSTASPEPLGAEELDVVEPLLTTSTADAPEPEPDLDPVALAQRERDEYRDALQRLQADFENYKKRVDKQRGEIAERATESLVETLLPVLDTADLAVMHGAGEDVKQVTSALFAALEKEGLERIDLVGPFDPTLHDAVAHEPAAGDESGQEVVHVLRAGYRWKGRVLRPAMVKVRG